MSVFNIPNTLLEAIDQVINPTSWRRDIDIRPFVIVAGLYKKDLNEVYEGDSKDFGHTTEEAKHIHHLLDIPAPTPNIKSSLDYYSGNGSFDINDHLWKNYLHGYNSIPAKFKRHIDNINSVLKPSTTVGHLKLYTGLQTSPADLGAMEWNSTRPIKLMHLPAFTSTTTNFNVAARFSIPVGKTQHHESDHHGIILPNSRHILELNFHDNIHQAGSIMNHSAAPHEEEILLGPNHSFELHPRPTKIQGYTDDPLYVWKAISRGVDTSPYFKQRELK